MNTEFKIEEPQKEQFKSKRLSSLIWILLPWGGVRACSEIDGIRKITTKSNMHHRARIWLNRFGRGHKILSNFYKKGLAIAGPMPGLVLVFLMVFVEPVSALDFYNKGRCEWSAEVLKNPDLVIEHRLQWGDLPCDNVKTKENINPPTKLPFFGTSPDPLYPTQAIQRMLANEKYYSPKIRALEENQFFEPSAGFFREYKIRGKKSVPPIEGHETLEYTVELLFDHLAWMHIPGVYPLGLVPICERNMVKLYVVKTDLGWYTVPHLGVGRHAPVELRAAWHRKKPPKEAAKWIARDLEIAKQCPDTLN